MKKIISAAALVVTSLVLATPAHADEPESNFGSGVSGTHWNIVGASICVQELAAVPAGEAWTLDATHSCANGNVLNHTP